MVNIDHFSEKQNVVFQKAIALHQAGKLNEAEVTYKKLLKIVPNNTALLTNLGIINLRKNNFVQSITLLKRSLELDSQQANAYYYIGLSFHYLRKQNDAIVYYEKAIAVNSKYKEAYFNLGNALKDLRRFDDSLTNYDLALKFDPTNSNYYHHKGLIFLELENFQAAIENFDNAIQYNPQHLTAFFNRANAYKELKEYDKAIADYDRTLTINPTFEIAINNRGTILQCLSKFTEALATFDKAIAINPNYAEAYNNRGNVLQNLKKYEDAVASYDQAIAINSNYPQVYYNRGLAFTSLKKHDQAYESFTSAIILDPNYQEAYNDRGCSLKSLMHLTEALEDFNKALTLNPNDSCSYNNRGLAYQDLKNYPAAIYDFDKALTIKPDSPDILWNKSLLKILLGDYEEGWLLYEWGWKCNQRAPYQDFIQPLWLGEKTLVDKTILIRAEQGLGDYIQFIRYASLIEELGSTLILEAPQPLLKLLSGFRSNFTLIEAGTALPDFDYHCPVASLPLAFKTSITTIPANIPYLYADSEKKQYWQKYLGIKSKPRVGLVWSGSLTHANNHNRSMMLSQFKPLLILPIELHCLQKEISIDEQIFLKENPILLHHETLLEDFSDTAALLANMDIVISVDTSVAHLAGAMGRKVYILLPYSPDYRWLAEGTNSPWYPTATLFRQSMIGNWSTVIDDVISYLEKIFMIERVPLIIPKKINKSITEITPTSKTTGSEYTHTLQDIKPVKNLSPNYDSIVTETICQICSSHTQLLDVIDFNKSCEELKGSYLPLSGIPIYYRICNNCEFVFAPEFRNWEDCTFLEKIYNKDYLTVDPDYTSIRPKNNFDLLTHLFGPNKAHIKHLDYGGGNGLLSNLLKQNGWETNFYDPFPKKSKNIIDLEKANLITAFEVFEHVPTPITLMDNLLTLLSEDGIVLFSTLVTDGNIKKNERINWWYAAPRNGHISLFSRKSLELLCSQYHLKFGSFNNGLHFFSKSFPKWASHLIQINHGSK